MSDADLRELERTDAGSARHLLARMRAGTLTRERVELAAYCGDAAALLVAKPAVRPRACTAMGVPLPVADCVRHGLQPSLRNGWCMLPVGHKGAHSWAVSPVEPPREAVIVRDGTELGDLEDFARGLTRWGHGVLVRAGTEAARAEIWHAYGCDCMDAIEGYGCPTCLNTGLAGGVDEEAAIDSAHAWLLCPCEEHRVACALLLPYDEDVDHDEVAHCLLLLVTEGKAFMRTITLAAMTAGARAVHGSISTALIEWALE